MSYAHPIRIQRASVPGRRLLATSDLHGEPQVFRALLDKAGFCEDDVLVLAGDFVRHGPQSLRLLRDVMALCKTHTVIPLCGNNDLYTLDAVEGEGEEWEQTFLQELETPNSAVGDMWREQGFSEPPGPGEVDTARKLLQRAYARELEVLRNLPAILDTGDYLFVHGGLTTADYESLEGQSAYSCTKVDAYLQRFSLTLPKYCVVGHWPLANYRDTADLTPIVAAERRVVSIDGGCGVQPHGQANLLLLPRETAHPAAPLIPPDPLPQGFAFWHADLFPVYTAQIPQLGGQTEGPLCNLHWGDQLVDVLAQEEGMLHLRHRTTGGLLWVPEDWVWEVPEGLVCRVTTNATLPVEPGDRLSLVCATKKGAYVKKGSACGWYLPGLAGLEPV